jgi:multiple antibiotic resistance protein
MLFEHEAVILFLALFALSSPVAALSSYLPIVRPYSHVQQLRLAVGLAVIHRHALGGRPLQLPKAGP